jgi:hypothetical protein
MRKISVRIAVPTPSHLPATKKGSLLRSFGAPRCAPKEEYFMADDMEKNRGQQPGQSGQQGTESGQHGQGQSGQPGNQSGQSGQKKGGQGTDEEDENLNRQRRAS